MEMVKEVSHEWHAFIGRAQRTVIRANPNGTFSVPHRHGHHRSVTDAAKAWAEDVTATMRKARERATAPHEPGGPKP